MGISPETIYGVERKIGAIFGSLRKPIKIESLGGQTASISEGIRLDKEEHNWLGALSHFSGVCEDRSRDSKERIEGAIWGSQMLVNLGRFNQADGFLNDATEMLTGSDRKDFDLLHARILEKRAWVADYRADFDIELNFLLEAEKIYNSLGGNLPREYEDSRSTIEHFLGRSRFGLAWQGKDRKENLEKAAGHFKKDLERYELLRSGGNSKPFGEGFNHLWLARCYSHMGNFNDAEGSLENSHEFLKEESNKSEGEAIMAHYYLVKSEMLIMEGRPQDAVVAGEEALRIRMIEKPHFPKGEIEALLVLGLAYWQEGKLSNAIVFVSKGLEVARHLL